MQCFVNYVLTESIPRSILITAQGCNPFGDTRALVPSLILKHDRGKQGDYSPRPQRFEY